jgi:hypothetical protein
MKSKFRALAAGAAAAATVGLSIFASLGGAQAGGGGGPTPPWQTAAQPNILGFITFYNAHGQVVTGGSTTANGLAAYAVASAAAPAGYTKATLHLYTPTTSDPSSWTSNFISASTAFPNASAPAPVGTTPNPAETNSGSDQTIASLVAADPNMVSQAGYPNLYDVRMSVTGPGGLGTLPGYYDTVISVNTVNNTWTVDYPDYTQNTTTTLIATPPSPQTPPANPITLQATVAPATAGTVSFWSGSTQIGTTQTVTGGDGVASVTTTPPTGSTPYTAVFTPGDVGSGDIGSNDSLTYIVSSETNPPSWEPVLFGTSAANSTDTCLAAFTGATSVTWAWQSNGSAIGGATSQTFKIPGALVGDTLTCSVLASNGSGSVSGTSAGATVVAGGAAAIRATAAKFAPAVVRVPAAGPPAWIPVLHGTVKVGSTDTCEAAFQNADTVTYAWQANGTAIGGATKNTYKIAGAEVGKTLTCSVKATNVVGSVSGKSSGTKVAVGPKLVVVTKPVVSGAHLPGKAEKVTAGKWSPAASKVTYQWFVGTKKIAGATKSSFTVPKSTKKGATVHCVVTASATGYADGTYTTPSVKIT